MPGVISAIHVKEGDYVNAGKVLASLDVSAMRKGLDELHSGIALATTMYEKQKNYGIKILEVRLSICKQKSKGTIRIEIADPASSDFYCNYKITDLRYR